MGYNTSVKNGLKLGGRGFIKHRWIMECCRKQVKIQWKRVINNWSKWIKTRRMDCRICLISRHGYYLFCHNFVRLLFENGY